MQKKNQLRLSSLVPEGKICMFPYHPPLDKARRTTMAHPSGKRGKHQQVLDGNSDKDWGFFWSQVPRNDYKGSTIGMWLLCYQKRSLGCQVLIEVFAWNQQYALFPCRAGIRIFWLYVLCWGIPAYQPGPPSRYTRSTPVYWKPTLKRMWLEDIPMKTYTSNESVRVWP
jgi:hypothetical protein